MVFSCIKKLNLSDIKVAKYVNYVVILSRLYFKPDSEIFTDETLRKL